jgi:hemerythrin-like domain-containing protein
MAHDRETRRTLLHMAATTTALALAGCARSEGARSPAVEGETEEAEVTPGEDLMQEHGVLERLLLVYDEAARRIETNAAVDAAIVAGAAVIIRRFVEEYHEKLEEKFVFPRLQSAGREVELVAVLLRQHERGRQVTEAIVKKANAGASLELAVLLRAFARMYRPHAAREDTVLFPAFRSVVGRGAYRELGEQFEHEEHRRFGERGFENTVAEVAKLEAALDIGDLAKLTP